MNELDKNVEEKKVFVLANLIKDFVYLMLAILLVGAVYYVESTYNFLDDDIVSVEFDITDDSVFLDKGSIKFLDSSFLIVDETADSFVFTPEEGRLWANLKVSPTNLNVVFDNMIVIPDRAVFDLLYEDNKVTLSVYDGDVYVAFLPEDLDFDFYVGQYSEAFMNVLLVPRDTSVNISLSKINKNFRDLLPSKLVKVMNSYSAISSSMRDDEWVKQNLSNDIRYVESIKQRLNSEFTKASVNGFSMFDALVYKTGDLFTFVPDKNMERDYKVLFSYLDEALAYSVKSDTQAVNKSLAEFDKFLSDLGYENDEIFKKILSEYISKLMIFDRGDSQYIIYRHFLDLNTDLGFVLDDYWHSIYSSMNVSDAFARDDLRFFYKHFEQNFDLISGYYDFEQYIMFQNQLFDSLFLRSSIYYLDEFFEMKGNIEQHLLSVYVDGQNRQELIQSFVDRKIDFLKRAWVLLKNDDISLVEAQNIYDRLLDEVSLLLENVESDTAVMEWFRKQLKSIENFWGYLGDAEYNSSSYYGLTHGERFEIYLKERNILPNLTDRVLGDIGGLDISLDDLEIEIKSILSDFGLKAISIRNLEDTEQRYVEFKANIAGYDFTAEYDRYNESLLRKVMVNDELLSDRPVTFSNLLLLIEIKYADLAKDDVEIDIAYEVETNAERVARNFVHEMIQSQGFVIELDQLKKIEGKKDSLYRVTEVHLEEYPDVIVTFDYIYNEEQGVVNLYFVIEGKPVVLDGPYTLEALVDLVTVSQGEYGAFKKEIQSGLVVEEEIIASVTDLTDVKNDLL